MCKNLCPLIFWSTLTAPHHSRTWTHWRAVSCLDSTPQQADDTAAPRSPLLGGGDLQRHPCARVVPAAPYDRPSGSPDGAIANATPPFCNVVVSHLMLRVRQRHLPRSSVATLPQQIGAVVYRRHAVAAVVAASAGTALSTVQRRCCLRDAVGH